MLKKFVAFLMIALFMMVGCAVQPIRVTKSNPLPSATNEVALASSAEPTLVGQWVEFEEGLLITFDQEGTFELNGRSGTYLVDNVNKLITFISDEDEEEGEFEYALADDGLTLITEAGEQVTLTLFDAARVHPDEQAILGAWVDFETGLIVEFSPDGRVKFGEEGGVYFLDRATNAMLIVADDAQRSETANYWLTESQLLLIGQGGEETRLVPLTEIDPAQLLGFWQGRYEDDETLIQYVYELSDEAMIYREMTVNKLEQTYSINEYSNSWRLDGNVFQQFWSGDDEPLEIVILDVTDETMTILFPGDAPFEERRAADLSLSDPPEGFIQLENDPITE